MGGHISPEIIEQVRAASDIVEIIGSYLPLKKAGGNFVALCPFHREKSPSFHVNPQRQIFHCFGCHKGGDVFTFLREFESLPFHEAVKRLADRAHITIAFSESDGARETASNKDLLLTIHEQITQRWQQALKSDAQGQIARDYLDRRQVSPEARELFRLGYAPENWDDTVNWARSKEHPLEWVEKAGLIIKKEGSGHFYDRFRGRLIFPICDEQGRVIAFSGRILHGDEKVAKYVNSPETPIFVKSRVFYGLDKSKRALLETESAVICEGQLDLISCHSAGVHHVVAPQGTAFTQSHAQILKRYVKEVVLCFDSDNAGRAAAIRVVELLLAAGLAVRAVALPAGHDPDSYRKEFGPEALRQIIADAPGFFDFHLNLLAQRLDLSTDRGRQELVQEMGRLLKLSNNEVLVDTYAQKVANRLQVSPAAVRVDFKKAPVATHRGESANEPEPESAPARPPPQEFWLLKYTLLQPEEVPWLIRHLDQRWITHPLIRQIIDLRLRLEEEGRWLGFSDFLGQLPGPDAASLVTEAGAEKKEIKNASFSLKGSNTNKGVVQLLRDNWIKRELLRLNAELNAHPEKLAEKQKLIEEKESPLRDLRP